MTELDDHKLLAEFARSASESAFDALVARHVNLVYSTALRFTGNPHHAQEITQAVFVILARKAGSLRRGTVLSGWLYQTARLTAANFVKGETRRQRREQEAYMLSTLNESGPAAWQQIAALLDDAMGDLGETDRNAVVLRFFENKTAQEVGAALNLTEAAAHKRVSRALEKLRLYLSKRGIALPAAALTAAISANAVQAAPVGLAITISTAAALAGTTLATATTATAIKTIAMTTLQKTIITATLAIVAGVGIYEASQAARLRGEINVAKNNQSEYLQKLKRERDEASNHVAWLTEELAKGKSNNLELLRLRGEVGALRQQLESQKAQAATTDSKTATAGPVTFLSKDQITNAGFATPEAALLTHMYGRVSGNFDLFISTFSAGDLDPNRYYGDTPREKALERWKQETQEVASTFQGQQILAKHVVSEDKVDLQVLYFEAGKFPHTGVQRMQKEGNQWKIRGGFSEDAAAVDSDEPYEIYTPSASR